MDYFGYLEFGAALTFSYLVLRQIFSYLKVRVQQKTKQATLGGQVNPMARYSSFREIAMTASDLLDKEAQAIAEECRKGNKDPMQDTGYMHIVKQHQDALKWKARLDSPLGQIVDDIAFPLVKNLAGDSVKSLSKILKTGLV